MTIPIWVLNQNAQQQQNGANPFGSLWNPAAMGATRGPAQGWPGQGFGNGRRFQRFGAPTGQPQVNFFSPPPMAPTPTKANWNPYGAPAMPSSTKGGGPIVDPMRPWQSGYIPQAPQTPGYTKPGMTGPIVDPVRPVHTGHGPGGMQFPRPMNGGMWAGAGRTPRPGSAWSNNSGGRQAF